MVMQTLTQGKLDGSHKLNLSLSLLTTPCDSTGLYEYRETWEIAGKCIWGTLFNTQTVPATHVSPANRVTIHTRQHADWKLPLASLGQVLWPQKFRFSQVLLPNQPLVFHCFWTSEIRIRKKLTKPSPALAIEMKAKMEILHLLVFRP